MVNVQKYASELCKHGFIQTTDDISKDDIKKIVYYANKMRKDTKHGPHDLSSKNIGGDPVERLDLSTIKKYLEGMEKYTYHQFEKKLDHDDVHPLDIKWLMYKKLTENNYLDWITKQIKKPFQNKHNRTRSVNRSATKRIVIKKNKTPETSKSKSKSKSVTSEKKRSTRRSRSLSKQDSQSQTQTQAQTQAQTQFPLVQPNPPQPPAPPPPAPPPPPPPPPAPKTAAKTAPKSAPKTAPKTVPKSALKTAPTTITDSPATRLIRTAHDAYRTSRVADLDRTASDYTTQLASRTAQVDASPTNAVYEATLAARTARAANRTARTVARGLDEGTTSPSVMDTAKGTVARTTATLVSANAAAKKSIADRTAARTGQKSYGLGISPTGIVESAIAGPTPTPPGR